MEAEEYHNRGIAKDDLQDYDGAIKDFSKAIEINPNFAEAYNNRGNAKANLQDYDGAIEDYNKAIEINPNYAIAYCNRGGAKVALQYYHEAIEDYNKAIEINPNLALAYYNRGIAYEILNEKAKAITDFLTCLYLSIQQKNEKNVYDLLKELEAYPQNILYAFEELNLNIPSFSSFQLAYDKLSNFNLLLDYWENTKKITDRESLSSKALLYYYLGGNVQSFHIYDEDLDDGENPMSAQNLYYYALTAQEICYYEAQTILKDCICQLKEKVDKTDKDNYYLGHLYLLNGETKKATEQFNQSSAFHFSSIMLKEQVDKKDFSKIVLSGEIDYNKDISQFSDYFHFRECCNNNNINYTDIWEAFTFKLSFCGEINIAERKHEAEIIINELSKEYETETINWYDQLDEDNKGILKETKKHIEKLHFNLSETQQEYKIALCIIYLDKDPINASIKHYLGYVYYKFILNSLTAEALFYLISFLRCRVNDKKHDEIKKSIGNIFLSKYHYKEWINIAQGLFWSSKEDNPLKKIIDEADKNKKAYIGFRESIWKILRLDKEILSKKEFNDKWKCLYFP
jgi:lipoprotein NlpI